jgi:hypothetical protein
MGVVFWTLGYASGFLILVLAALSMSSGLFLLAELAEEFPSMARKIIQYMLVLIVVLHVVLYIDGLPFLEATTGVLVHTFYSTLLNSFPFIEIFSIKSVGSVVGFLICNAVWLHFFYDNFYEPLQVIGFFVVCVWSVPIGLFVSLTLSDNALPGGGGFSNIIYRSNGGGGNVDSSGILTTSSGKKRGLYLVIYDAGNQFLSSVSIYGVSIFNIFRAAQDKKK